MVVLTDITAMRLWATPGHEDFEPVRFVRGLEWSEGSWRELRETCARELGLLPTEDDPMCVLVDGSKKRIQSKSVRNRTWSGQLPAGALYQVSPGILVTSPEFCCLLDAARESVPHVIATVMEFMGLYGRECSVRGFVDREQLLSKDQLERYIQALPTCPGRHKLQKALVYALERSRSPMETKVIIILTLPGSLGGYGLPLPTLNYRIVPGPEDYPISQFSSYEVDACWLDRRTVLEFDSYFFHMSPEKFDADAKKRNSLKSMGWKVSSVTAGQLTGDALDVLAHQLAKDLGVELKCPTPERRDWLLSQLV